MERYCCQDHSSDYRGFFQKGEGSEYIPPFIGVQHQRGYGIGSIFGFLARTALKLAKPALKSAIRLAKPAMKQLGKVAKREAIRRGKKVGIATVKGILEGKKPVQAVKEQAKKELEQLGLDSVKYAKNRLGQLEFNSPDYLSAKVVKELASTTRKRKGNSTKVNIKRKKKSTPNMHDIFS